MDTKIAYKKHSVVLTLAALMLGVALLSVFFLSKQSLRLDESQSMWQSSHTTARIFYIVAQDVHVPLYHMMLHFWQAILGNDVAVARYLSLIFSVLTIPAVYKLGRYAYGQRVGLFASLMISLSPFLNWYANEVRMYSLLTFLTVMNQYFFLRLMRHPERNAWIGYTVTALLGMYTHYFFFMVFVVQLVFLVINRHLYNKKTRWHFFLVGAFLIACFTPWIWYVLHLGSANNTRPLLITPTSTDVFNTFSQFLFGFQNEIINTAIISLWPLLVLVGFFSLRKNRQVSPQNSYFFLSASLPIILTFVLSVTVQPLFLSRYLILAIPSLYLFIAWLFYTYPTNLSVTLRSILIIGMACTLGIQTISSTTPVKENYLEASQYLTQNAKPQDIIILSAPFTVYPVEYYYHGTAAIETLPQWDRFVAGPIPPFSAQGLPGEVNAIKKDHRLAWLLLSYNQGYESKVKDYFDNHFERIDKRNFSLDLNLYVYKLRY
jgi:mannosyltransferase